ncbi:MAG: hypothetical protein EOO38_31890 [Cytophagaceae bacterium]|nr:MAG: hypothetical protein EOO38_31890 [Cytophagaceae bacterium]
MYHHRTVILASLTVVFSTLPVLAGTTILKGATICRTFESAKAMQWANSTQTSSLIKSGKCYTARGNALTISAEDGPDIVEFRTADNPTVLKYTLVEYTRAD